ncbi:uncharacterized protein DNG_01745 [Cephalotrichum gorgonifer]|uniref:Uncharacterized protein n=1 Tax=Cephalotrichum gorgonifer TaxID=2041049 RepID=A0AAE8MSC7_9PEZI|nr:uncharacterized protein DNG_01745 [Cephalotrichum gorgonifer]
MPARPAPRRTRQNQHTRNPSNPRAVQTSDYESDAANYLSTHNPTHPPHRTNTELNLGVLRRYVPSISAIVSISANAVLYTFDVSTQSWDKSGVEGTLFVCTRETPSGPASGDPRPCVFVLNRRGLDNLMLDLDRVRDCEVMDDLLILGLENGEGGEESEGGSMAKAMGIWMHADGDDSRRLNMNIIRTMWEQAREARRQVESLRAEGYVGPEEEASGGSVGPAVQAIGKQLSIDELFASQAGGGFGR